MVRELVGDVPRWSSRCRDPLTTLTGAQPGSPEWDVEAAALRASDAQMLLSRGHARVSRARATTSISGNVDHRAAHVRPTTTSLRPWRSSRRATAGCTSRSSARRDDQPGARPLVRGHHPPARLPGLVVHRHFFDLEEFGSRSSPTDELAEELDDYHAHPTVPYRWGTRLSDLTRSYDLMGVFHELEAAAPQRVGHARRLAPTKAVSGWLHGGDSGRLHTALPRHRRA